MDGGIPVENGGDENIQRTNRLNEAFKNGQRATEVLDDIQAIPRPILVDMNNVLINNVHPFTKNPEASKFLSELRSIGNVVIATTANDWETVHDILKENGLWHDEIVLMALENWRFMARYNPTLSQSEEAIEATPIVQTYIETCKKRGLDVSGENFRVRMPANKPLAPLFNKPFDIPIIDNDPVATDRDNGAAAGVYGIQVKPFETDEFQMKLIAKQNATGVTFSDASALVRNYYNSLATQTQSF